MKLVTQMTDEELRTEDYDLELEWQHYDFRCDGACDESRRSFELSMADIDFRRTVISIEEARRFEARRANEAAEEFAYQRMVEA